MFSQIDITGILSTLGTLTAAFLSYNQYAKNKKIDLKIEQWKAQVNEQNKKRNDNMASIFGELWGLLHESCCSRVYIIQPHPLINSLYVSVTIEVKKYGVSSVKTVFNELSIEEISGFVYDMSKRDVMVYEDIDDIKDNRARAILFQNGSHSVILKRLVNTKCDWTGTLVVDYTGGRCSGDIARLRELVNDAANSIQYILPEYK